MQIGKSVIHIMDDSILDTAGQAQVLTNISKILGAEVYVEKNN